MYWVEVRAADVRILCGCPEDSVKHLLRTGLIAQIEVKGVACETGPNAILLSDLAIQNGREVVFEKSPARKADEAEFIMLKDGGIAFEGNASELREMAANDLYVEAFLA